MPIICHKFSSPENRGQMIKNYLGFATFSPQSAANNRTFMRTGWRESGHQSKKWVAILLIPALLLSSLGIVLTESAPVLAAPAAITHNLYYDLATDPLSDWTIVNGGAYRTGIRIESTVNTLWYYRDDLDIDNHKAFQIEAVVSGSAMSADGELGARMWVKFRDDSMSPGECINIEVRFVQVCGGYQIDMMDGNTGWLVARLDKDWTKTSPRLRVRIKRQEVSGQDYILLQSEESSSWDDPAQPNNLNTINSQAVAVQFLTVAPGDSEIGFGNPVAGNYYSDWESVHITTASDLTTVLPYWPPKPTAPILVHDDKGTGNPQGVDFSDNLTDLYLANDTATPTLDANGMTLIGVARTNPGNELWYFAGINDNQTVHGRVKVSDVSGRSRTSNDSSLLIQTEPINTPIPATVDIDPNTLNSKSQSDNNGFTTYIELPAGYDVGQISVSTVRLIINGVTIFPQTTSTSVGDYDSDMVLDRMVKFARQAVITALGGETGDIGITVTGQLNDGSVFTGSDTIKVINPGK